MQTRFRTLKSRFGADFWIANSVYAAILVLIIVLSVMYPKFRSTRNIINLFSQSSTLLIVSMGMALCIITKGIDMSVGGIVFLSAAVMQVMGKAGYSPILMALGGVLAGTAMGALNGIIAATLKLYPLLSTLAIMNAARGLGMLVTGGGAALMPADWGKIAQLKIARIPVHVFVAIGIAVAIQVFLNKTRFGRHIYAVGDSEKTANEKGLSVKGVKFFVYTASGCLCGIAAIVSSSQVMGAPSTLGTGIDFYAIIAAVLGGCSLFGGKGTVFPGVMVGALIMSVISNALVITGASPNMYPIVYALVIFLVVLLDAIKVIKMRR